MTENELFVKNTLVQALEATQWGFNLRRCPVCAGWNGSRENDMKRSEDCIVRKALLMAIQF